MLRATLLELMLARLVWSMAYCLMSSGMLAIQFFATWFSWPHLQHTPSWSFVFPQPNFSDFIPGPFFDPPSQLFMYNANSARLSLGHSILTGGPGAAMSDSFSLNCLSAEVIFSISSFLDFSHSESTVQTGAQDLWSPIKSLLLILRSSSLWLIALSCWTIEKTTLIKMMILTVGSCVS